MDAVSVTEYASWARIITTNIPLVLAIITICFGVIGLLFRLIWEQRKEIVTEQRKTEKSEISRLVEKIGELVDQTKLLFLKHDNHEERIDTLEKKCGEQMTRCAEREKSVKDQFKNLYRRYDDEKLGSERLDGKNQ